MSAHLDAVNAVLRDEPVTDEALAVGLDVAATWAQQDRYDPHRPVLSQVVAEAIERRGMTGPRERATEALREQVEAEHRATLREQQRADEAVATLRHLVERVELSMRNVPRTELRNTTVPEAARGARMWLDRQAGR